MFLISTLFFVCRVKGLCHCASIWTGQTTFIYIDKSMGLNLSELDSSYDNQIVWLSVFNDCQHAAFHAVLNFPRLCWQSHSIWLSGFCFYPELSTFTWVVRNHSIKDLLLATKFIWLSVFDSKFRLSHKHAVNHFRISHSRSHR